MSKSDWQSCYRQMHEALESVFHAHLLALASYRFAEAAQLFCVYHKQLNLHIELEDTLVIPVFKRAEPLKYWPASTFLAEHQKIQKLASSYESKLHHQPGLDLRDHLLALLEEARRLQHLIEHHHLREDRALFPVTAQFVHPREASHLLGESEAKWDSLQREHGSLIADMKATVERHWQRLLT
ncbi:MAG: hypothetical protein KDC35_09035 [Acidobacteria bacterium]|nr:hypothetical protein [Acidobacteriota bacterium]